MQRGRWKERKYSEDKILNALRESKKTNKQLLTATQLSEPTLAKRLADLERRGEIISEMDSTDRRSKIYSITLNGWENLEKKSLKENIDLTPLIINNRTLHLEVEWPEWYIKRKGWDDPRKAPITMQTPSHISPVFELRSGRKSKILKSFWDDIYRQFRQIMRKRYPQKNEKELNRACNRMTEGFFDYISHKFNLNIFSSLKMKPPETSKWDMMKPLLLSPLISPIKMDFYTKTYITFFEHFLELFHETLKSQYASIEDPLLKDTQDKKMIIVMELNLDSLSEKMKTLEGLFL